jgi:molybdenum cofactor cytidylyltransferase
VAVIAAVILAAGSGSRFGSTKQLADIRGRPMLQHVVDAAASAAVDEIVLVLGADADRVRAALDVPSNGRTVVNERHSEGQSTSLSAGLRSLRADCKAAVILLGDQPTVPPAVVDAVIEAFRAGAAPIVRASYRGTPGHPVLLAREVWPRALGIAGDVGARDLIAANPGLVHDVDLDLDSPPDVDTQQDRDRLARTFPDALSSGTS